MRFDRFLKGPRKVGLLAAWRACSSGHRTAQTGFHLVEAVTVLLVASLSLASLGNLLAFEFHELRLQKEALQALLARGTWTAQDFSGKGCAGDRLESGKVVITCKKISRAGKETKTVFLVN